MKKRIIIPIIILLSIGFASISTTLIIGGITGIGINDTFENDVIFTFANLPNGEYAKILNNGKSIEFKSAELFDLNSEVKLDFKISNKSREYDATGTINCDLKDDSKNYLEYFEIKPDKPNYLIAAGTTDSGSITVKLKKVYAGENVDVGIICNIDFNALERTDSGDELLIDYEASNIEYINEEKGLNNVESALNYLYEEIKVIGE